jgi:hypothetical protein
MEQNESSFILGAILCVLGTVALFEGNAIWTIFLMGLGLSFMALALGKDAMEKLFDLFADIFRSIFKS